MLIPLTQSVYVAGELVNADNILLDIGTGYFVEVPCKDLRLYTQGVDDYRRMWRKGLKIFPSAKAVLLEEPRFRDDLEC